ncbi:CGNR zinc finger domain-containing protein [Pseudarthrobacter sp. P1]|uniref:CGNR zinc finger domain-containing protein n=1 Tax=Pseudarthrobacter sp. P1 TaxID=3418418 RepID=UPI003CF0A4C3
MTSIDVLMALLDTRAVDPWPELLYEVGDLKRIAGHSARSHPTISDLRPVRRLRDELAPAVLGRDLAKGRRILDELARKHAITPALGDGGGLHFRSATDGFAGELAAVLVLAAMELYATGLIERVCECSAPGCVTSFVDSSRKRNRTFCSAACGTRMRVRRYRERQ